MVYDGAVKDEESSPTASRASAAAAAAAPEASEASAAAAAASQAAAAAASATTARPAHDKRLGVRHPLKHRLFRAGGKTMGEPGGLPSAEAVVIEGEEEQEEEEASDVEEEGVEASSAERELPAPDLEVSSAPTALEEDTETETDPAQGEPAPVVEDVEMEPAGVQISPESAVAVGYSDLLLHPGEVEEDEEVSSVGATASVTHGETPQMTEEDEEMERERQKERERMDEVGYMSGGWKSPDGSLNCGYSSFRGKRASMEDFYDIKSSKIDDKQINLFGIFDGHGGSRAAEYLKEHLFENLMKHPEFMTNTKLAISETYKKTDSEFLDAERNSRRDDGSTASTAVLVGDHLYVANVGDSRAVISKAGKAIALSDDHKPNRSDERERIENAGGVVMWAGTWRVGGVLAMSRAFGNRLLKQFVIAEPEIQEQEINDELDFLIIASDGLWDVVPNEYAVSLVKAEEEPEAAARTLTETAFSRGSGDNITCIVVKFERNKTCSGSPHSSDKS